MNKRSVIICSDLFTHSGAGKAISKVGSLIGEDDGLHVVYIGSESNLLNKRTLRGLYARFDSVIRKALIGNNLRHFTLLIKGFLNTDFLAKRIELTNAVVVIGWAHRGFLDYKSFLSNRNIPIIIRLSDEWLFTGGCHFPGDCKELSNECSSCPEVRWKIANDLSKLLQFKRQCLKNSNIHLVFPSLTIMQKYVRSFPDISQRSYYIPTSVDTTRFFCDRSRRECNTLDLSSSKDIIFTFAAADPYNDYRKNIAFAIDLVEFMNDNHLASNDRKILLIIIGGSPRPNDNYSEKEYIMRVPYTSDVCMIRQIYSYSSLHLTTSYTDNLPNTTLEAMACGCPLASFETGGLSEITQHGVNGLLFKEFSRRLWADSIMDYILNMKDRYPSFSFNSRRLALAHYSEKAISTKWQSLINSL